MDYRLNDTEVRYQAEGNKIIGGEQILLHDAIDLTQGLAWSDEGYVVTPLFDADHFIEFECAVKKLLLDLWKESGLTIPNDFQLDQYHTLIPTQEFHLAAVEKTKLLGVADFPVPITLLENRMSDLCKVPLIAKNPFDNQSIYHFRVVRPHAKDHNPLHRDVWLEDYANCINLYIPIAGSTDLSSLAIVAGSHRWPENKIERTQSGATIGGTTYNVPAVTKIPGAYEIRRPNPQRNEVLVFSPYLIHGGAVNLNQDKTRISIELRLWKRS